MATINDYLNLLTSAWRDKPNFTAMVSSDVSISVRVQELLTEMAVALFDVDTAIGDQLDIIGKWAGISRDVNIPIDGVYFSWDGAFNIGWEYGVWRPVLDPTSVTILPDDVYRTLIRAKIAANRWDGTTTNAYEIWSIIFPDVNILIVDHQDMSYDIGFVGGIIDSLTLALVRGGYLPLKPEGVRVNVIYTPVNDGPLFGWDLDSDFVQGWEDGSWAFELI